ncbi:MAG: hypothetical protein M1825_005774 [Sarcosagium campestre]|nr:MAG: hypothetical protein M1825_005774 [Sarcosagium campestre]
MAETLKSSLTKLDEVITKSKNLRKASPIRLVAVGGFVSVSYFGNRHSTEDVDYIIDPSINNLPKIKTKFEKAILEASEAQRWNHTWINDSVTQFAVGDTRLPLFQESVAQNEVLWAGTNLIIYAVKWEWSLAHKVKRIGSTRRPIDIDDAVVLLNKVVRENGGPITRARAKNWNQIVYTPIEDHVLDLVAAEYSEKYQTPGLV